MRKRRLFTRITVLIVVLLAVGSIVAPMMVQNILVRRAMNDFFRANQFKSDREAKLPFYDFTTADHRYLAIQLKHPLVGWKILTVGGQPYPMSTSDEDDGNYNYITAECYYRDLPAFFLKKNGGRYVERDIAPYGKVAVVPVTLNYKYRMRNPNHWIVQKPDWPYGKNWIVPWDIMLLDRNTRERLLLYFQVNPQYIP